MTNKEMYNTMKRLTAILLSVVIAGSLTACGTSPNNSSPQPGGSQEAEQSGGTREEMVVHVGDFLAETFLYPVKIANELGFFEEEFAKDNITISIDYIGSGAVMTEALTAGELDMSFLGGQPAFSGISNGNGVKIVSMATTSSSDPCLLVSAGSDITDVSQLKGKNLAVNIGTDNHYQLVEMLGLGGLTEDDINLYNLKGAEAFSALMAGEIDCMQSIAPNTYQFVQNGEARILATMDQTEGRNNQVLVAAPEFVEEHGDIIVRFLQVLQRALDYYAENTEECKDLIVKYVGENVDRNLMDEYMDKYDCSLHLNEEDKAYLERQYEFLYNHDMLSSSIDLETVYDDSFLIEAFGTAGVH